jgi:hypothetical protein
MGLGVVNRNTMMVMRGKSNSKKKLILVSIINMLNWIVESFYPTSHRKEYTNFLRIAMRIVGSGKKER